MLTQKLAVLHPEKNTWLLLLLLLVVFLVLLLFLLFGGVQHITEISSSKIPPLKLVGHKKSGLGFFENYYTGEYFHEKQRAEV